MRIERIDMKGFMPFRDNSISFPCRQDSTLGEVQLVTGQNGTGKTRLLCALLAAFGNEADLDARFNWDVDHDLLISACHEGNPLCYSLSRHQAFLIPNEGHRDFLIKKFKTEALRHAEERPSPQGIEAVFVHQGQSIAATHQRSLFEYGTRQDPFSIQAYRGAMRICQHDIAAFASVSMGDPRFHASFERPTPDDKLVCQSIANQKLSAALEQSDALAPEMRRYSRIVDAFEATISSVTGRFFAFRAKLQPQAQLSVVWGDVNMKLEELPDGLRSIIGWLVACITKLDAQFPEHPRPLEIPMVLMLDEPETHLHPAWQRKIIPAAQKLFSNAQIFVATHSPFVISSVNSGWIHILRADANGLVTADDPRRCSKGDSWIDAVEDVLGVTEWYDPETETLLAEFRTLKREVLSERGDISSLKEKADAIASRSESLRSMMAREMHQLQRNMAEAVAEP